MVKKAVPVSALLLLLLALPAAAALRVLPPEFQSDYVVPTTHVPNPRPGPVNYLDAALLIAALGQASYLALKRRSRRGMVVLMVVCLLYFGFWRGGCVCAVGAIQNVVLTLFDATVILSPAVLIIFAAPLVFALLFGRTFCAAVCPLGGLQDAVILRPLRLPAWLEDALGMLAYAYLAAAVLFAATGSAFLICRYDPFVAVFRLVPLGTWARALTGTGELPGGVTGLVGRVDDLLLAAAFLVAGLFLARPYCRFFCPYGVLLRLASLLSWRHATITPGECVQCRLCEDSCPFGAIREPTAGGPDRMIAADRRRLGLLLVLLPVFVAAGVLTGRVASGRLSRMHRTVRLAERIALEEAGTVEDRTDASKAFRGAGQPKNKLYEAALAIQGRVAVGSMIAGGFLGLVAALKLIRLAVRRTRRDYEPDRGACLSCARCFPYCPVERQRLQGKTVVASRPETE
jgi:ferredoxin